MNTTNHSSYLKGEETLLHYLVREPKIKVNKKPPLLLLLHGVGSNEKDLFSLAETLPPEFLIVSARAPYTLGNESYAWYHVDFSTGKPVINKEQAEKSRSIIIQFINQLKEKQDFDEDQVYLSGFSQGGIMAYSVGLTRPDKIKGIAVLSGRLLEEVKPCIWEGGKLKNLNVFILHGKEDPVLHVEYAKQAVLFLKAKGVKFVFKEYNAGHTIIPEMQEDLTSWLKTTAANKVSIN